jgi:hypothetical protein
MRVKRRDKSLVIEEDVPDAQTPSPKPQKSDLKYSFSHLEISLRSLKKTNPTL